jgi:hypothetical protein
MIVDWAASMTAPENPTLAHASIPAVKKITTSAGEGEEKKNPRSVSYQSSSEIDKKPNLDEQITGAKAPSRHFWPGLHFPLPI